MILTNLNRDHGFVLPSLGDLGLTQTLFPENVNMMPVESAFYLYRPAEFNNVYDKFVQQILQKVTITSHQKSIVVDQVKRIKKTAAIYFDSCNNQVERKDLPSSELYESFDEHGCAGFKFDQDDLSKLKKACSSEVAELKKQPDRLTSPTKHDSYDRIKILGKEHLAFQLVDKLFTRYGVFDTVTKYNRNNTNLQLHTVALHIARPNDTHHYQTLSDVPGNPKTISFHMDPKFNVMKAILYLNDVDDDNGPFTTIPGSNRWFYPEFERVIGCGNSVGNYLSSPDHRTAMSIFPETMTKNVIVGKYLKDGSDASNLLLSKLHKYTSDQADCILFDPAQTIHRGGLCNKGERVNLQIIMR